MADRVVKVWDQLRNRAVFNAWSEVLDMKRQEAAEAAAMAEREVRAKKIFARAESQRAHFLLHLVGRRGARAPAAGRCAGEEEAGGAGGASRGDVVWRRGALALPRVARSGEERAKRRSGGESSCPVCGVQRRVDS